MTAHAPARLDAHGWFVALLDAVGSGPIGKRVRQCPGHGDGAPSLSVGRGEDGRVLLHCHAGCDTRKVLAALRCPMARLFKPATTTPVRFARMFCGGLTFPPLDMRGSGHPGGRGYRFESEHPYGDRWWLIRHRHPVTGAKELSWECRNPDGLRVPGLLGTPTAALPAYMAAEVGKAVAMGEPVLLVESESSVDALMRAGWYATTWAGGAASVQVRPLRAVLADYPHTVVIPDHDDPGLAALATLRTAGLAPHVLMPDPGEDARELLARVGPGAFRSLIEEMTR
ncbi:MAG: hypothetical protein L0I76_26845 [Pseudonocardia sp.]|nr:hypothetical protein [Pseudonocardia sp.]